MEKQSHEIQGMEKCPLRGHHREDNRYLQVGRFVELGGLLGRNRVSIGLREPELYQFVI